MRNMKFIYKLAALLVLAAIALPPLQAQSKHTVDATDSVQMTVKLRLIGNDKRMPEVNNDDVIVKQGEQRLQATNWTPARGDKAGLELFVLIDDAADSRLGLQLDDLRDFINAQPPTTTVGVGYMRNNTVQILQDLTTDHGRAADALRSPLGNPGAFGSPYLSVIDLMKRWPASSNRHEIVMISDGIDRFRSGSHHYRGLGPTNPDVTSASAVAQKNGTIIHTIFTRGVGRMASNYWAITNAQLGMARLSDETGGESYYLGTHSPVSFRPYLGELQDTLDNQYLLEFRPIAGKKAGLQPVKVITEVAGVEFDSADSVWVEAR
jgi:hypothetical protein